MDFEKAKNLRERGNIGEDIASDFLRKKGFTIVKRNFRFGRVAEIDIVAQDKGTLVFVEVKSRKTDTFGDPILSITPAKQRQLRKAAEGYLYINKTNDAECRFDVVIVDFRGSELKIDHLVNAF